MPKRVPPDFIVTPALQEWARKQGISDRDVRFQTEVFMDHEFKRSYTDWPAVWRNWMRKSIQFGTVNAQESLDAVGNEYGLTRRPGETSESFERRVAVAITQERYKT